MTWRPSGAAVNLTVIVWCALISAAGHGDALSEQCRQRDSWCASHTFVWDVTIHVSLQPSNLNADERALLKSQQAAGSVPLQRAIEGYLVVSRVPNLTYVGHTQAKTTLPEQTGQFEYWFGKDFIVYCAQSASTPNLQPSALVLPAPAHSLSVGALVPPSMDELGALLHPSFVAGSNPLHTFAPASLFQWRMGNWSPGGRQGHLTVFRLTGVPGVTAEIYLDGSRRFAPASFDGKRGAFHLQYRVLDWKHIDEWWLPSRVQITQTGSADSRTVLLTLRRISTTPTPLNIHLPPGTYVTDLRHIDPETIATGGLLSVRGTTYQYPWAGRLPDKGVLPAVGVVSPQPFTMVYKPVAVPRSTFPVWQAVVALLLITGGGIWYWRARSAKGANKSISH